MTAKVSIGTAYGEAAALVARERRLVAPLVMALLVVPVAAAQLVQPANPFAATSGDRGWIAVAALAFLIGLVGQMALSRMAMVPGRALGETIGEALRRVPGVLLAFLLFGLCVSAVLIPLMVVEALIAGVGQGGRAPGAMSALAVLLALAAIPRVLPLPAVAMAQPAGPWALLKRTWQATSGNYWRLLGFFLIFLLASQVMVLATSAVVGGAATLLIGPPRPLSLAQLPIALAIGVVQGIAGALYAAMLGRITVQLGTSINGI